MQFDLSETPSAYSLEERLCACVRELPTQSGELRVHPNTAVVIDALLSPIRREEPLNLDKVTWRWGTLTVVHDDSIPEGTVLLT